jgi:hypothetical protein
MVLVDQGITIQSTITDSEIADIQRSSAREDIVDLGDHQGCLATIVRSMKLICVVSRVLAAAFPTYLLAIRDRLSFHALNQNHTTREGPPAQARP